MPTPYKSDIEETQVSYRSKSDNKTSEPLSESNDFVSCDKSDKSSDSETYVSCDSSLKTKTKDFPPTVDIKTWPESDVDIKTLPESVRVKKCFVCGSKLHLIKDCDFYNCVESVPCKSKAASVPAGSRNSSASVTAGGSDPAASGNRPAINSAGSRNSSASVTAGGSDPAASRNRPAINSAGRPNPTGRIRQAAHHAGWSKRPAPVSAGRPVSAGWLNPAARPYFRPSSVYFNNMYRPELYDPMYMNEGRWATAGDPSTDNDIGIVDSGCSRSMTGNKEKNLIQVLKIHTDDNVADLLTKAFDGPRFKYLVVHIGMVDMVFFVYAAELVCAGSIMFLLADLFLLVVTCFCCLNLVSVVLSLIYAVNTSIYAAELFDIAGWLVSATSHLVSAGSLQSCWCNNVSAE
ncbi:hypothetical protein Tco_1416600 [Tanacetum coccineum]